ATGHRRPLLVPPLPQTNRIQPQLPPLRRRILPHAPDLEDVLPGGARAITQVELTKLYVLRVEIELTPAKHLPVEPQPVDAEVVRMRQQNHHPRRQLLSLPKRARHVERELHCRPRACRVDEDLPLPRPWLPR